MNKKNTTSLVVDADPEDGERGCVDDAKLECFIPGGVEGVAGYRFGCAIGTVHGASSYLSMKVAGGGHINDARNLVKLMTYIIELHATSPSLLPLRTSYLHDPH